MTVSTIAAVRAILLPALPASRPSTLLPKPLPSRCTRMSRVGGPRDRDLDRPRILVECFASTSAKAPDGPQAEQDICTVDDALRAAANGGPWAGAWVTGWDLNTIVDFPDPDQPSHARWQLTGTLFLLT